VHRTRVDPELAEVCRREHARLVELLTLDVGDPAVAEELAWATLVRLHEHWPRIAPASAHAWVSATALDLARSRWRRHYARFVARRRQAAEETRSADATEPTPPTAPTVPDEGSRAEGIRDAVSALPASQRAALLLRYHAELSEDETAAALGCPPEAVRSLVHAAVNALRLTFPELDDVVDLELLPDG
jgi:RNA polymerase sigma factor (sigma-70 family)